MSEERKKNKKLFVEGPISAAFIADSIAKHSAKTDIGAHQIFLGQIRADKIGENIVKAIEFSAYLEMAEDEYYNLREYIFSKYKLSCMHVYHSLGLIKAGEINLFVFTSSQHRNDAIEACKEVVEYLKKNIPIWGKEIFEDANYTWKVNN